MGLNSIPPPVYLIDAALVTPLGMSVDENLQALIAGKSGIDKINDNRFSKIALPLGKIDDNYLLDADGQYLYGTRFDTLLMLCVAQLKAKSSIDFASNDVFIILSTTKGNIELLDSNQPQDKLLLSYSANRVQTFFNNPNTPWIISNACISGISAYVVAERLLSSQLYKHIVVIGCDVLTEFVISGFTSFHAISDEVCKPFDLHRKGISLGEACAASILSNTITSSILLKGGTISNDSNHISGPSKTGEELSFCIKNTLETVNVKSEDIDFISAHGTATNYNDEMESLAIEKSNLSDALVFSLKANYGHTLGAAGILETVIAAESMKLGIILPSQGYNLHGVSGDIQVNKTLKHQHSQYALKTGSGFGGCNASLLLERV